MSSIPNRHSQSRRRSKTERGGIRGQYSEFKPLVIRDPVHNMVRIDNTPVDRLAMALIKTSEFQRLRHIRQLGFADLVYPGATHSRLAHSIGVMAVARLILSRLASIGLEREVDEHKEAVVAAALLHDVGHGPFSHAFEQLSGVHHEVLTRSLVKSKKTAIGHVLREHRSDLPDQVAAFFTKEQTELEQCGIPPYMQYIVSGQLDADRLDYLLRDGLHTGVTYGTIDIPWIVNTIQVNADDNIFYVLQKGVSAIEEYVYARYHMYRSVYFHKSTRAAEQVLRLFFKRLQDLCPKGSAARGVRQLVPDCPQSVVSLVVQDEIPPERHMQMTDHTLWHTLYAAQGSPDRVLRTLAERLVTRNLYKVIEIPDFSEGKEYVYERLMEEVRDIVKTRIRGSTWEYYLAEEKVSDNPYPLYWPKAREAHSLIHVATTGGMPRELSTLSEPIQALTRRYEMLRLYCPAELKEVLASGVDTVLRGGS